MQIGRLDAAVACVLAIAWAQTASAQTYPSKPVRMVVPYSAGGGLDMMCRTVADRLGHLLRQSVVIENRVGASGTIGTAAVAKAAPDGYTIHCGTNSEITLTQYVLRDLPYDPERELEPLTMGVRQSVLLVAHPSLQAGNMKELVALARTTPQSYGHLGVGHTFYLAMSMLNAEAQTRFTGIPYKGAANAVTDVLGGHIKLTMINLAPVVQHIKDAKVKPLLVFQSERNPAIPDVPTAKEVIGVDVQAPSWFGFFSPAGLLREVRSRLEEDLRRALADPGVKAKLGESHMEVMGMASAEFAEIVKRERASNGALVKRFGIKPE
jgi:tripartite-type tricarboxylate transporter receptor subunit TctC